jgi:hypothetical protein
MSEGRLAKPHWQGWAVATVVSANHLPQARVCLQSFLKQHPGARAFVLLVERTAGGLLEAVPEAEIVSLDRLGLAALEDLAFKYDAFALSTALKPFLAAWVFERTGVTHLAYLDSDILVFRPFDDARQELENRDIVVVPHLLGPMDLDGRSPDETDFLRAGAFNTGFVGLRKGPGSARFLDWWKQRLTDFCLVDPSRGLFSDQKWMDLALAIFDGVGVLRHPGYDVAYWNLGERGELRNREEGLCVGETPLVFFHFSGLDRGRPAQISRHQNRFDLDGLGPAYKALFESYVRRVSNAEEEIFGNGGPPEYSFGRFSNGARISGLTRELYRSLGESRLGFVHPFDSEGAASFFSWMLTPDGRPEGPLPPLVRFGYQSRHDLWRVFPDPEVRDRLGFFRWVEENGAAEFGLDEMCLAPVRGLRQREEERIARDQEERARALAEERRRQDEERARALAEEQRRQDEERARAVAEERKRLEGEQRAAAAAFEARFSGPPETPWKRLVAKAIGFERYAVLRKAFWVSRGILRERKTPDPHGCSPGSS